MGSGRARAGLLALVAVLTPGILWAGTPEGTLEASPRPASFVGVLVASHVLDVTPQVEGRLETLKVRLGERVGAGQTLALLELQPFQLELAGRDAGVQGAEAEESRAVALLEQARRRAERERRITQYSAAEALESAENDVALATADLAQARARLAEARVRQAQAARNLEQARLKALFAGIITEFYMQPGVLVSRSTPILRLVSEELRLRLAVPESVAYSIRLGTRLRVRLETMNVELMATVDHISPEIDTLSRHQKMEARLEIPESLRGRIPTGLMAAVELLPDTAKSARQQP
jgi:RND family efflux transporter MFP subunit